MKYPLFPKRSVAGKEPVYADIPDGPIPDVVRCEGKLYALVNGRYVEIGDPVEVQRITT